MAEPTASYDVWLTAGNRAYRGVPFGVVTDWIQQGRVAGDDRVRPAGGGDWWVVADTPSLAAFLPRPEPQAADDAADAYEPVAAAALPVRPRSEADDEDVDMIP